MERIDQFLVENFANDMCQFSSPGVPGSWNFGPTLEAVMELPPPMITEIVTQILESPARSLSGRSINELGSFHDALLSCGIGIWWEIREPIVPKEEQVRAVQALIPYLTFLDSFCDEYGTRPATSATDLNHLDDAVSMTWRQDTLEAATFKISEKHLWGPIYTAMEHMLTLSSCAMQLGGLLGLIELKYSNESEVVPVIDRYLESGRIRMPWLRELAVQAAQRISTLRLHFTGED